MPKSPNKSSPGEPTRRDQGVGDKELEDRVGRRPDEKPEMVPPGTTVGRPEEDGNDTRQMPQEPERDHGRDEVQLPRTSHSELDDQALEADRANARKSDRMDARDGVDASDTLPVDPDAVPGAVGRTRA
ncbi:MAG TPA: hypothetical protein VM261_06960 [Kofleriaceae bacterium]|nr:hypothetical protein [Kofleriaceae bacterium]